MTSKVFYLGAVIALTGMLGSCISSDSSTYTTYDDVAITSFTLGKVKCVRTVKKSDGTDSTYTYTYTGSTFPIHIDQNRNLLYNSDSLVVGSDLSRILVTIGTRNGGSVSFKNIDAEGYTYYSSSDSVDLSQERTLVVYSNDGAHSREYKVNIVSHKEYADSFTWDKQTADVAARLATFKKMKGATLNGEIYLLASDDASTSLLRSTDGKSWTDCQTADLGIAISEDATIASFDGKIWLLSNGALYNTLNGDSWMEVCSGAGLAQVLGGYVYRDEEQNEVINELYALSQTGKLIKSVDSGVTWTEDDMESTAYYDNSSYLPVEDLSYIVADSKSNDGVGCAAIVGNLKYTGAEDDTFSTAVVWNKTVDADEAQGWCYNKAAWNNTFVLPRMENLSATGYADGIVAIGGMAINNTAEAYSQLYYSPDYGTTWHKQVGMSLPDGFKATKSATIVADGKGYIYILTDGDGTEGQVWKGRKNSETWTTTKKLYN